MNVQIAGKQHDSGRRGPLQRVAASMGVLLLGASLAVLGNVAWQLWGTGISTEHAQHRLAKQFNAQIARAGATSTTPAAPTTDTVPAPTSTPLSPPLGTVVGHLVIPKAGVNAYVVEGVGSAQLAEGVGHYPGTAAIGQRGNVGIAGHRTTHDAPFFKLNDLHPGDLIYLTDTGNQTSVYRVTSEFVVTPNDASVLNPVGSPTLTLTTCNPRYSAAQRLIVRAALQT